MIAIVDSGSTKSSWVFVDEKNQITNYKTVGFNPYYQTADDIYQTLQKELISQLDASKKVDQVFFYGAGCEGDTQKKQVGEALKKAFPQSEILVDHDLMAACRAVLGDEEGIACIAGTGSNTCHYDGKYITKNINSLGLYLGDEGSGGYLGKILARDYIREAMPQSVRDKFEAFTTDRHADIFDKVYTKPFPNRYLASLAPFVIYNQDEKYLFDLAYENFSKLFENCVCRYDNYQTLPIRFIGSVAAHLRPVLDRVAKEHNVTIDKVVGNPMEALTEYHIKNRK
jgi:glucosamine kinase